MAEKILLVEDDRPTAQVIKDALAGGDYDITHAGSCEEGLRVFKSLKPALVVLDVGLPDGSGFDVCRKIRSDPRLGATPVVILTGKSDFQDKSSGFEAGADHYLVKPLQITELRLWVGALLKRVSFDELMQT